MTDRPIIFSATMTRDQWSQTIPATDLPKQRAFYAKLSRKGPRQAVTYGPWLAAIDGATRGRP
jgi:hypothetical protein